MFCNGLYAAFLKDGFFGKVSPKKLARYQNDLQWRNTFINYMNMLLDVFEWNGLPDTCDARYLELALVNGGLGGLFLDGDVWLSLPAHGTDAINIYGYFEQVNAYGANGYNKPFKVYIPNGYNEGITGYTLYDNEMRYPPIAYLIQATDRITSAMRSIDVAAKKLKNPYFINCEEPQVESVRRILKNIDENEEAILASDSLNPDSIKVFPTHQDCDSLGALWQHYFYLDSEIRQFIGVDSNPSPLKKERLIVDEVNSNNEMKNMSIDLRLKERERFCKIVNENTDLNISVKVKGGMDKDEDVAYDSSEQTFELAMDGGIPDTD